MIFDYIDKLIYQAIFLCSDADGVLSSDDIPTIVRRIFLHTKRNIIAHNQKNLTSAQELEIKRYVAKYLNQYVDEQEHPNK